MRPDDPRVEELIETESFHHFPGTTITVCAVKLCNGQQIVAHVIGADTTEFDLKEGQEKAAFVARRRIAGLESYVERRERTRTD